MLNNKQKNVDDETKKSLEFRLGFVPTSEPGHACALYTAEPSRLFEGSEALEIGIAGSNADGH